MSAFFLEAGFLGIMLFGMNRVGKGLHFAATGMVAFGTVLSATWILAVNSWMHTPAGYEINEVGQFIPVDWFAVIFNPQLPLPFGPHDARGLSDDGVCRRCDGCLASVAR